jgi:iron complex outermembrane receptor protein
MTRLPLTAAILAALGTGIVPLRGEPDRELPPLVVTGRRGSVLPEHFSGNATVIEEKEVAESGSRSLGELLENRGGLRITSATGDPARGSISLRGFGENAASRTLILIDGKPVNRPDMAAANLQEIPLARVARVEILRGSQTARFGDQAVGGVINIVTKQPTTTDSLGTELATGSDGWLLARVSRAMNRDGHQLTLDAEFNHTDGWRENSMSEAETIAAGWSHRINPAVELNANLSWGTLEGRFPGPLTTTQYLTDPRQSIYSGPFADQYGSSQNSVRTDFGVTVETGWLGTLELPATWQMRDLEWNMGPGSHADNSLQTLTFSPTLRQSGGSWTAEQGLALRTDWLDVTQFREMARLRPSGFADLERTVLSAFDAGEWEPWQDWHFNAAARAAWSTLDASSRSIRRPNNPTLNFDQAADETNGAFQAGVRWEPTADLTAWLRYDRLYRLPSIDEIASYQGFPLAVPFNANLHAETGHNIELGGEWTRGPWRLRANGFAQWLNGEIAYDYTQNLNVNLADTRRLGGELEASYQADHWSATVRYAGVDARFTNGPYDSKSVPLVPNHQLGTLLEYRPHRRVTLTLEHQWQSPCTEGNDFTNTQSELPSFAVMNLMITCRPTDRLACYFRVANLWDEHYSTLKYSGLWYPAAGRQFQFGIRHAF